LFSLGKGCAQGDGKTEKQDFDTHYGHPVVEPAL